MNSSCMSIKKINPGFRVDYRGQVVSTATVNWVEGTIEFTFSDGKSVEVDVSEYVDLSSYTAQFGITLTDDGTRFFVQCWHSGLFCFETQTGRLLWRNRHAPAKDLGTHDNTVLCYYGRKCVALLDIETGMIAKRYPLTSGTFYPICQDYYLAGPKRGYYEILDSSLIRRAKIHASQLNPHALDSFIIQEASFSENVLVIRGVEYVSEVFHNARKSANTSDFMEKHRYERHVPVCIQSIPSSGE